MSTNLITVKSVVVRDYDREIEEAREAAELALENLGKSSEVFYEESKALGATTLITVIDLGTVTMRGTRKGLDMTTDGLRSLIG